jgi:hypothetical protein
MRGWRLAREELCSCLHDAELAVPSDIIAEIKTLAASVRLDEHVVRMLAQ